MSVKKIGLHFAAEDFSELTYRDPFQAENIFAVTVQSAGLSSAAIQSILARLVSRFAGTGVEFTTDSAAEDVSADIFIGLVSGLDLAYPGFSSFAETSAEGAKGFVDLDGIADDDAAVAAQIENVAGVLTGGPVSFTGTIADFAFSAANGSETSADTNLTEVSAELPLLPAPTAANAATVYEATADDFDTQLTAARLNMISGGESIIRLTGGNFVDQNVYAEGVEFQITGGSTGANNYFYGGSAFNSNSESYLQPYSFLGNVTVASSASAARGFIGGGKFLVTLAGQSFSGGDCSVALNNPVGAETGAVAVERLVGGAFVTANPADFSAYTARVTVEFDSSLSVAADNVAVSGVAVGGSLIGGSGNLRQIGTTSLAISGGSFYTVAGGSYLQHINAGTTLKGDTTVLISGGSFSGNIFGGHLSFKSSNNTQLDTRGNISLTIDASQEIFFGEQSNIVAGQSTSSTDKAIYTGNITGNVTVTFTGDAANLKGFCGTVWGDCGMACTYTDGTWEDHVQGNSTLVFDDFSCTDTSLFNASRICCFDTYTVTGNSHVVLSGNINARGVDTWNIQWNESEEAALVFEGVGAKANFAPTDVFSSINLQYGGTNEIGVGESWTVIQAVNSDFFANFTACDEVLLFGEKAELTKGVFASAHYELKLMDQAPYKAMVVTHTKA